MNEQLPSQIRLAVLEADSKTVEADVLALTHAQAAFGSRMMVLDKFEAAGIDLIAELKVTPEAYFADTFGAVSSKGLIFVNIDYSDLIKSLGYRPLREFSRKVLTALTWQAPDTRHLALTMQGMWLGLDEIEALESEIAGILDAVSAGAFPASLERIDIVEKSPSRATRLQVALARLLPDGKIPVPGRSDLTVFDEGTKERLRAVGYDSATKPHIFVAMPYTERMDDVFHYGIQNAVRKAGYLCERADFSSFTGDAMDWIRKRIAGASLVIADLTDANPNVYLEVGYAWGRQRPTVLLVQDEQHLQFDVKGHKCLFYSRIKELEEQLTQELVNLREVG